MSADILAQSTDANEVTITVLETETSTISDATCSPEPGN
jgi:hypothetical protein